MKKFLFLFLFISVCINAQEFVSVKNGQLFYKDQPYYFLGTNYWYSSLLGLNENPEKGINRLKRELDFLKSKNITNIRVVAATEGKGKINGNPRIESAFQYEPEKFSDETLKGLDILLDELSKREMKAVIFLSNNWEWSGGFLQYLNWNGKITDEQLQNPMEWDDMRDHISRFYSCENCIKQYQNQVKKILKRKNSVNGKRYISDNSIMTWEIANEPRPMRPYAIPDFEKFISEMAALIKKSDKNHLVTTGSEGEIGSETMEIFRNIHQDKNIDYLTIHIWPKNWGWVSKNSLEKDFPNGMEKTKEYITKHLTVAKELNKPLVLEEFGFPRDDYSFDIRSSTKLRDHYFEEIFKIWNTEKNNKGNFAGCSFWAFGGEVKPISGQLFWKSGDDYTGDPPMEEQGLYSVFQSDESTWEVVEKYSE